MIQPPPDSHGHDALVLFGSLTWVAEQLWRHAPSWSLVPPLLIAAATFLNALRGLIRDWRARPELVAIPRAASPQNT